MLPIHFRVSLHGYDRHAERFHDFFRLQGPSHDHLTLEHPEAPHICLLVLKHRQVSVHITNLAVPGFYRDPIVNLGHSRRKDGQLHLWHASSYQPFATAATIFWLILISSTPRKSPVRSGGLKVCAQLFGFSKCSHDCRSRRRGGSGPEANELSK